MSNGRRQPSSGGTSRMTRECHVRFCERLGVQFALALKKVSAPSISYLVGNRKQRRRYGEAKDLGGLEIDDQLELCREFERQIASAGSLQYLVHIVGNPSVVCWHINAIANQATGFDMLTNRKDRWQTKRHG